MASQPQYPGASGPPKVAIPRMERKTSETPRKASAIRPNRVSRACLTCRMRKIRCDGAQPTCKNCRDNVNTCEYASTRKDRLKTSTEHNEEMLQLLKSLRDTVGDAERTRIDEMLSQVTVDVADAATSLRKTPDKSKIMDDSSIPLAAEEGYGEANISAEVGSGEDLDNLDEDLLQSEQSRATGYVGKNSEVQWLRRLNHDTDAAAYDKNAISGPYGPPGKDARASGLRAEALKQRQSRNPFPQYQTSSFNFNLDDETLDMDFSSDPLELPSLEIADKLVKYYMASVQNSFPILVKKTFYNQFYDHYASRARGASYNLPRKWQAMLNLVFAIGAAHSQLIEAEWRADARDHSLYHSRAWRLSLKDPWWFSHPDLPQTQISGLLAMYYLAIGHTNRSWVVIGMAVRSGFGLGLHVRNEDRAASMVKKEVLARIWWGLYALERLLSAITGRPSVGIEPHCSVYLPLPISCDEIEEARIKALFGDRPRSTNMGTDEVIPSLSEASSASSSKGLELPMSRRDPANSGTFLTSVVKLGKITQRVLYELYSPAIVVESWQHVQKTISIIMQDLEAWAVSLPLGLDIFSDAHADPFMAYERSNLKVFYYSTKILISRPCLCRIDHRIPNESQTSTDFNQRMASTCVIAAKAITALLPDDMTKEKTQVYGIFPWWAAVHYIMQSLAILMLELSYEALSPHQRDDTVIVMKKLVRWLRALKTTNGMATRAHTIILDLLQKMTARLPIDISDLLAENHAETIITEHHRPDPPLFTSPFIGEDFLKQYSFPQQHNEGQQPGQGQYASYQFTPGDFQAASYVSPDLFTQTGRYHSNSPLPNVFLTEFDQYNPLPIGADVYMRDYEGFDI